MSSNEVESVVQKSSRNLTNIKELDLSSNNLGGTLHNLLVILRVGSTKNSLENLDLSSNQLRGLILDDEKRFRSLKNLYLDSNRLESPLPNHLSRFPSLQSLSLDENQLTRSLPDLSSIPSLEYFSVVRNKFNCTSIESIGNDSYLETLDVSSS